MRWLARLLGAKFKSAADTPAQNLPVVVFSPFIYFRPEDFLEPVAHIIHTQNPDIEDIARAWNRIGDIIKKTPGAVENGIPAGYTSGIIKNAAGCLPRWGSNTSYVVIDRNEWNTIFGHADNIAQCARQYERYDITRTKVVDIDFLSKLNKERTADPRFNPARDADILKPFFEAFRQMDKAHRAEAGLLPAPELPENDGFSRMAP